VLEIEKVCKLSTKIASATHADSQGGLTAPLNRLATAHSSTKG
jgi:hypothetical protein